MIRKAIEEFARDRTTFLITHSLGALQFADRIVLMNAGRIEAVGTEAELRRGSALYRKLHEITSTAKAPEAAAARVSHRISPSYNNCHTGSRRDRAARPFRPAPFDRAGPRSTIG